MAFLKRIFSTPTDTTPQHIRVVVAASGTIIAEATIGEGVLFNESSYYFDHDKVNTDLLIENDRSDSCTYQGAVRWYDVQDGDTTLENVAFYYTAPKAGYHHLLNKIGFYAGTFGGLEVIAE